MNLARLSQIFFSTLLMVYCILPINSFKILIAGNAGGGSHYFVLQVIGEALAQRGHNVTVFVNDMYANRRESTLLDFRIYKSLVTMDEWENTFSTLTTGYLTGQGFFAQLESQATTIPIFYKLCSDLCHSALVNKELLDILRSEKYDILVGDFTFICASLIGQTLDLPYILIESPLPMSWHASAFYNPINPSYIPTVDTGFDSQMTFTVRLQNTVRVLSDFMFSNLLLAEFDYLKEIHNIKQDVYTSLGQAEIWFINSHFSLDFPRPLMPNSIMVGGITTGPAHTLNEDLESFMQDADDGVIVFSLGGYVSIDNQDMVDMFATAFAQLRQRVVWKQRGKTPSFTPANVKQMKWIPQNDLLGHNNTRLLVYQCGINGVFEALYHGIPVICLPVFYDQKDVAQRVASKGIGLKLDITTLTSQELVNAIEIVIGDESFRKNMARMSSIFRDEPKHPADRAADWVEYVIRHGGAGHLRTAAHELNFFQYHLIDVIAFILGCVVAMFVLFAMCCRFSIRLIKTTFCDRKTKTE